MNCSVVIPTYNRRSTLERTLGALLNQTVGSDQYEIIVVDDASRDSTREYLTEAAARVRNLTCIHHEENRGRSATRNDGIRAARGEILVFLDDDNVPVPGFVEAHLRHHRYWGDQHIAVMGDARFAAEVVEGSNFGRFMQSRYLGCRSPRDRLGLDYSDLPARCFGTLNCSLRRADLLRVGLLDEAFRFYGGEDEYLGHCLIKLGVRIIFGEGAQTAHHDEVSLARYRTKLTEVGSTGLRVLMEKAPEYVSSTNVRYLVERGPDDPVRVAAMKVAVRLITSAPVRWVCEAWASGSDGVGWLYSPVVFRILTACWVAQGYRAGSAIHGRVTYGGAGPS